jgi:two-component system sensor histidine kinase YesM
MTFRNNTFTKIITLLILLLIPIIVLYSLSNRVSVSVLKEEIQSMKQKDLSYLASEFNSSVESLSAMAFLLSEDIHIQQLQHLSLIETAYGRYEEKSRILERLRLLNVTGRWDTQYSVIAPQYEEIVSTNPWISYDLDELKRIVTPKWKFTEIKDGNRTDYRYVRHIVKPKSKINQLDEAGLIVEVSFPTEYIVKDLDAFKQGGKGDPFMYHPEGKLVANRTADNETIHSLVQHINDNHLLESESQIVYLEGKQYLVNIMNIPTLDNYLIDYVPLEDILQPIVQSRNLFYGSVGLLLIMSLLAAYLLYKNVQRPIGVLIHSVQRLRSGDYSTRITAKPKNEFSFLFQRFNEMASEIDQLIRKVYQEQLRTREANLKQLQSQINPHFLYNCFALIRSLARLGKKESVMDLAMHLSKYYRYTTRVEKTTSTIQEELQLIESYLEIQKLHMQHLSYTIQVPENMMKLEIPRLLLQPIVENAVLHGIEKSLMDGLIKITGEQNDRFNTLIVEDNGVGMTDKALQNLRKLILVPPNDDTGCALWNIRERLILQFGEAAIIELEQAKHGGVTAKIQWPRTQ